MRTRSLSLVAASITVCLLFGSTISTWAKKSLGFRVSIECEGKDGVVRFQKKLKYSDHPKAKPASDLTLPAKVEVEANTAYSLRIDVDGRTVYGLLKTHAGTEFTTVGSVRFAIQMEQVNQALAGQVMRLTITDPAEKRPVAELLLGDSPIDQKAAEKLNKKK